MMNPTVPLDPALFDVRHIPCRVKHGQIFQRWAETPVGGYFVLVNDHDPVPLYYQFAAMFGAAFRWEYLVAGPEEFHVKISRLAATTNLTPPAGPRGAAPCGQPAAGEAEAAGPVRLDLRGLEPPEPMLRILTALEALPGGASFQAQTDRQPIHLFPELAARGARHESQPGADGSWITTITRG
jgi:uncharacterized protein (DUF2249 family)